MGEQMRYFIGVDVNGEPASYGEVSKDTPLEKNEIEITHHEYEIMCLCNGKVSRLIQDAHVLQEKVRKFGLGLNKP